MADARFEVAHFIDILEHVEVILVVLLIPVQSLVLILLVFALLAGSALLAFIVQLFFPDHVDEVDLLLGHLYNWSHKWQHRRLSDVAKKVAES